MLSPSLWQSQSSANLWRRICYCMHLQNSSSLGDELGSKVGWSCLLRHCNAVAHWHSQLTSQAASNIERVLRFPRFIGESVASWVLGMFEKRLRHIFLLILVTADSAKLYGLAFMLVGDPRQNRRCPLLPSAPGVRHKSFVIWMRRQPRSRSLSLLMSGPCLRFTAHLSLIPISLAWDMDARLKLMHETGGLHSWGWCKYRHVSSQIAKSHYKKTSLQLIGIRMGL